MARGEGEQGLDGGLCLDQLEVGSKLGSLRHLGRDGVDKLWHETGWGVVRLAEVVVVVYCLRLLSMSTWQKW